LNTTSNPPSKSSSNIGKTFEVNVVQSTVEDKASKGKKKGKGKAKFDTPKQDSLNPSADDASKRKPKYPGLICEEDHYTKDCPHRVEVSWLFKGTSVILKEPFLS